MYINKNIFTTLCITCVVALTSVVTNNIYLLIILATILLASVIWAGNKDESKDSFLVTLIFICIYIFYFGQIFAYYFLPLSETSNYIAVERLSSSNLINSARFSLLIFSFFTIGFFIFKRNVNIEFDNCNLVDDEREVYLCKTIGMILFLITIIPSFLYEYGIITAALKGGYLMGRDAASVTGIVDDLARLCRTSILLIIVGNKNSKKTAISVSIVYAVFLVFKMVVYGERGYAFINLLILFWIYQNIIAEKKIKLNLRMILVIVILLFSFMIVRELRFTPITEWDSSTIKEILSSNPITEELIEFGGTLLTVGYIFQFVPGSQQFLCGQTVLSGILKMLPSGIVNVYENSATSIIYSIRGQSSLGGSFIADIYLNFGYFGLIFAILCGMVMANLLIKITISKNLHNNYVYLVCRLSVFIILIWLVRGSFINVFRELEFGVLPVMVIYWLINRRTIIK